MAVFLYIRLHLLGATVRLVVEVTQKCALNELFLSDFAKTTLETESQYAHPTEPANAIYTEVKTTILIIPSARLMLINPFAIPRNLVQFM